MSPQQVDGALREWGTRFFYGMPAKPKATTDGRLPRLVGKAVVHNLMSASVVRAKLRAVVSGRAKEAVVKITGGGKGMKAIAAHFRYISRQGKEIAGGPGESFDVEDERGVIVSGKEAIRDLVEDWRTGGSLIPDDSHRKEAFNIMLSMPAGTPPEAVKSAARAFARESFPGHKYVFVLHTDTPRPHVHLVVRAERSDGYRLNPRKAELAVWRERFAERLQDRGINAIATPAATRGVERAPAKLWRVKAAPERIRRPRSATRSPESIRRNRQQAIRAWGETGKALAQSSSRDDRALAVDVVRHAAETFGQGMPEHVRRSIAIALSAARAQKERGGPGLER